MTISNTTTSVTVQGNGLTVTFSYAFYMVSADYAVLTYTDADGVESSIPSSDFSISNVTDPEGGTFTYPLVGSPIAASTSLLLQRILPLTQDVSIGNQGNFYSAAVETGLDYGIMVDQQLQAQIDTLTGSGFVTSIATGDGLTGGPITTTGTISVSTGGITTSLLGDNAVTYAKMQTVSDGMFLGNFSGGAAVPQEIQFVAGSGITIGTATASVTITASNAGTVTQVDTGTGLTGGPITSSGTVSVATDGITTGLIVNSAVSLAKMANLTDQRLIGNFSGGAAAPAAIALIAGANMVITPTTTSLTFAATTGSTASGTVTVVDTGTGLAGGPITTSGTVSLAAINTGYFLGNFSGGSAAPVGVQLLAGSGITFSSTTTSLTLTASGSTPTLPTSLYLGFATSVPSAATFTLTQGTSLGGAATKSDITGAMQLAVPAVGSGDNNVLLEVTPTGSFTLIVSMKLLGPTFMNGGYGLYVKDNAGKIVVFGPRTDNGSNGFRTLYQKWTDINTFSSNAASVGDMGAYQPLKHRLQLTGGNFVYFSSADDGTTWTQYFSKSATDFISSSISKCGVMVDNNQGVAAGPTSYLNIFNYSLT